MRLKAGAEVTLFDGRGDEFLARVESHTRRDVQLAVLERVEANREAALQLTIAAPLPKGDRQRWLVEKLTELGAAAYQPITTERSTAVPAEKALEKLRRYIIEASKQCRRNCLMAVESPRSLSELIEQTEGTRLIAHPERKAWPGVVPDGKSLTIAIGPEGGFSDAEVDQAEATGWQGVSLGQRILRVETAALALTTLALHSGE